MQATRPVSLSTNQNGEPRRPVLRTMAGAIALACAFGANCALADPVLPTGGSVAQGAASISSTSNSMQVNVSTSKAVINWNGFSIGNGGTVQFVQPSAGSVVLNRVTGGGASSIDGNLLANGQVFLVNANGVYFGPTAQVNVGGLVASTLDIADGDFMSGSYAFSKTAGSPLGQVFNSGNITAANGGYVALFGEQVVNSASGVISAPGGRIGLGVGEHMTVSFDSNQLLSFSVDQRAMNNLAYAQNAGQLLADGGTVSMTAMVSNALASAVVNQSGLIRAQGVAEKDGDVYLSADGGNVEVSGSVEVGASSTAPSSTLMLSATGGNVTVTNSGSLSASGANGTNLYAIASGQVSLNGNISAASSGGPTNVGVQGSSVALNSANFTSSGNLSSIITVNATAGGITQDAGGVLSSVTTASAQDAALVGGNAFAGVNLNSTGAQNVNGTVSTVAHGPAAQAAVSASSSADAVSVNQISASVDGGGTAANITLSGAGNVTTTGNLSATADAGPATASITAGGAVALGGNIAVQGASNSGSATLATITANGGDVQMASGTQISVADNGTAPSAGAGLSISAPQGALVLGDLGVTSAAGPAQTVLTGANGVTFAGNVATSGQSALINTSSSGGVIAVDAGKTVQATGTGGSGLINLSTPGGSLQIDGSLQAQGSGGGLITSNPASPWDTPAATLQLALDPSQDFLTRLLTAARTTPTNPFAGNGLIVTPTWNIVGMGPAQNGSMDAALYEDNGQDSIVPISRIKGNGAPINAAMKQ